MDAALTLQRGMRDREVCSVAFRFEVWQRRIAELVEQRSVRVVGSGFGGDVKRMRARNELAWAYVSWRRPQNPGDDHVARLSGKASILPVDAIPAIGSVRVATEVPTAQARVHGDAPRYVLAKCVSRSCAGQRKRLESPLHTDSRTGRMNHGPYAGRRDPGR